jgi:hypothetical protein
MVSQFLIERNRFLQSDKLELVELPTTAFRVGPQNNRYPEQPDCIDFVVPGRIALNRNPSVFGVDIPVSER